ncbi:9431_t:CDS:1, partial [Racocetra persica]
NFSYPVSYNVINFFNHIMNKHSYVKLETYSRFNMAFIENVEVDDAEI